jgi:hypothetical protein
VDVGGGRHHRDERLERARSDLRVEVALQCERAEVLAGVAANPVQQVRNRVATRPVEARREVDEPEVQRLRSVWIREDAAEDGPAARCAL